MSPEVFVCAPGAPWAIVSNRGTVLTRRRARARSLGPWRPAGSDSPQGYRVVNFRETGPVRVHRLVAMAFLGPPPFEGALVRHLNGDGLDNRVENLAWGTHAENTADMLRLGEIKTGPEHHGWKEFCEKGHPIETIAKGGRRGCRECRRLSSIQRYHRLMAEGRHPRQLARQKT